MTFQIQVKPMVQKFLLRYLGDNYQLSQADPFGIVLQMLCCKKAKKKRGKGSTARYTAQFQVTGNIILDRKKKFEGLTEHTTIQFNKVVELILKTEFHTLAFVYTHHSGRTIQEAVDDFMEKFSLTAEDIDPMSLRRSFLRYRLHAQQEYQTVLARCQRATAASKKSEEIIKK